MARGFKLVARGEGPLRDRYRPQRLSEIVPTFPMKEAQALLTNPNSSQVWLFEGLTGCGKTTLARIIARASVCEAEGDAEKPCLECGACKAMETAMDYTEINVARFGGKDDVRKKVSDMCYMASDLARKLYIFDEAHQLTSASQELMNKVLEEPIGDTLIFLCTTHKKGLKRTLLGRCAKINFRRMTKAQLTSIVKQVVKEAEQGMPSDDILDDLYVKADGSVRDLLNLMDRVLIGSYQVGIETSEDSGAEGAPNLFKLVGAFKEKNWNVVRAILNTDNVKNDPDGYRETVCAFLAREALNSHVLNMNLASALGHLGGSLYEEPRREQHSLLVLRSMRACYKK
jgi:DNA polymerase III subunit gamma/tau